VLEPGNGVADGIVKAGVAVVELPVRLKTGIDQSESPLHRHLHNPLQERQLGLNIRFKLVFDPTV